MDDCLMKSKIQTPELGRESDVSSIKFLKCYSQAENSVGTYGLSVCFLIWLGNLKPRTDSFSSCQSEVWKIQWCRANPLVLFLRLRILMLVLRRIFDSMDAHWRWPLTVVSVTLMEYDPLLNTVISVPYLALHCNLEFGLDPLRF